MLIGFVSSRQQTRQRHAQLPQHGPGAAVGPARGRGRGAALHRAAQVSAGAAGDPRGAASGSSRLSPPQLPGPGHRGLREHLVHPL